MESKHALLVLVLLVCSSGIASAVNDTIVDMDVVKAGSITFWEDLNADNNNIGNYLLGLILCATVIGILCMLIYGTLGDAIASRAGRAKDAAEHKSMAAGAIKSMAFLVLCLILFGLLFGLL